MMNKDEDDKQPKVLIPGENHLEEAGEGEVFNPEMQTEIVRAVKGTPENIEALIEHGAGRVTEHDDELASEVRAATRARAVEEQPVDEEDDIDMGTAHDLLVKGVVNRGSRNTRLRSYLTGTILVHLTDTDKNYIFDWSSEKPRTGLVAGESADCTIHLSEQSLTKIAQGDLNPQIGMLSEKIRVKGRLELAVYFFNLLAPHVSY